MLIERPGDYPAYSIKARNQTVTDIPASHSVGRLKPLQREESRITSSEQGSKGACQ